MTKRLKAISKRVAHLLLFWLVVLGFVFASADVMAEAGRRIETDSTIGLANGGVQIVFDKVTGELVSLRNLVTGDEYLKNRSGRGNPFRVYVNSTELPWFVTTDHVQPEPGDLGGIVVDPARCTVAEYEFDRKGNSGILTITSRHMTPHVAFKLVIELPDDDVAVSFTATVTNPGSNKYTIMTAMPYLTGLGLGEDTSRNLAVRLYGFGQSRGEAWANAGSMYGWRWGGQWNSVYDLSKNQGLGLITKDTSMQDKAFCRHPGGVMYVFYPDKKRLDAGESLTYPTTDLIVHEGNWKVVAHRYGDWFRSAYTLRPQPAWVDEIDLFRGSWIPHPDEVARQQKIKGYRPGMFTRFEELPNLYLNDQYDLKEWAQYWEGVNRHKIFAAYNHTDGIYDFREDLGGIEAFSKGVENAEKIGRDVGLYLASRSVRSDSLFFSEGYPGEGTRAEDWLMMTTPTTTFQGTNERGDKTAHMCFRYAPWQDYFAGMVKDRLRESKARYVRIDEFGTTWEPCFNPVHQHASPFNAMPEAMEFLRKLREVIDEVDSDIMLFTENTTDMLALYCDGALNLWAPGPDIAPMRLVIPNYIGFSYHLGQVDCALNGFVPGFTAATTRHGFWNPHHGKIWSPGLEQEPANYPKPGSDLRWHEIGYTFRAAARRGVPTDINPVADVKDAEQWAGRLWQSEDYWLVTCGDRAAIRPEKAVEVKLPELPDEITFAFEFDLETLEMKDANLRRTEDGIFVTTTAGFSAILLPKPNCPPLIEVADPGAFTRDEVQEVKLTAFAPWRSDVEDVEVKVEVPGLKISQEHVSLPTTITITATDQTEPGFYKLLIQGDCLPVKKSIRLNL